MEIKTGIISNNELLSMFGTKNQIERYEKDKKLNSGNKTSILKKASMFCNIEDLSGGKYRINKIYNIKNEDELIPLSKGLSKYLAPNILSKILEEHAVNNNFKTTLSIAGWAQKFEIINENYPLMKYHQDQASKHLNIDEEIICEYYEKMDACLKYYLEKNLNVFAKKSGLNLIEFDHITMVRKRNINQHVDNQGMQIKAGYLDEVISDEDRKFVFECEEKAERVAGIKDNREKFYGFKSMLYRNELRKLLIAKDILFTYRAYNIYCKNPDSIEKALQKFNPTDDRDFVQELNEAFMDYIENKAIVRHKQELKKFAEMKHKEEIEKLTEKPMPSGKIKEYRKNKQYIADFKVLSETTVRKNAPSLKDEIRTNRIEDMGKKINFNINFDFIS